MACGLPVVAPNRGAFPEMIEASGGGLLCEAENSADLSLRLQELLADPKAAREKGERGRRWVEATNSRLAMASATAGIFESVLAETQQG